MYSPNSFPKLQDVHYKAKQLCLGTLYTLQNMMRRKILKAASEIQMNSGKNGFPAHVTHKECSYRQLGNSRQR